MNRLSKTLFLLLPVSLLLLGLLLIFYPSQTTPKDNKTPQSTLCQDCNIILITMTNLRYDHMSSNGYSRPTTPNLDKLAKESLVFDNAFSHSSWTLPEGISLYTGLYPYQHGIMNRYDGSKLGDNVSTLVDILNKAGYQTVAFTGGFDYNPKFGLTNRFSRYVECDKFGTVHVFTGKEDGSFGSAPKDYGEFGCTVPQALEWLKENYQQKFFLHVQGFDAHCPFSQKGGKTYDNNYQGSIDYTDCLWTFDRSEPVLKDGVTYYPVYSSKTALNKTILLSERDIEHLVALYDESITAADSLVGSFLEEVEKMGLSDKTIIIFTSEHGDMFGKHGRFMRGGPLRGTLYDDVLHAPLIIKVPKFEGQKIEGLAGQVDIVPTLTDFLGLKWQGDISGRSLLPLITQNREINEYVYAGADYSPGNGNQYFAKKTKVESIRSKSWKLIEETVYDEGTPKTTFELYDVLNDKEELKNLYQVNKLEFKKLHQLLGGWSEAFLGN